MDALTQMLATGWPLALAGFVLGALAGGWAARRAIAIERATGGKVADSEVLAALAEELAAARELLDAEDAEAGEIGNSLKDLDEAVKRANGRLKLISNALSQPNLNQPK